MKTRFSNTKSDLKKSFPDNFEAVEFRKLTKSAVGSKVYGIMCSKSPKFGGYNYALACADKVSCYWLNIPGWLGSRILDDFNKSGQTCSDYFNGPTISDVVEIPTDKGNPTHDIVFQD